MSYSGFLSRNGKVIYRETLESKHKSCGDYAAAYLMYRGTKLQSSNITSALSYFDSELAKTWRDNAKERILQLILSDMLKVPVEKFRFLIREVQEPGTIKKEKRLYILNDSLKNVTLKEALNVTPVEKLPAWVEFMPLFGEKPQTKEDLTKAFEDCEAFSKESREKIQKRQKMLWQYISICHEAQDLLSSGEKLAAAFREGTLNIVTMKGSPVEEIPGCVPGDFLGMFGLLDEMLKRKELEVVIDSSNEKNFKLFQRSFPSVTKRNKEFEEFFATPGVWKMEARW